MRRGWLFILIAAVLAGSLPALAQVPTSEQLELLRTLSPEDRQALMEQLGIGGSGTGDAPTNNSRNNNQRREGSNSDAAARRFARQAEEIEADKTFAPDDTLIVDIDFKKDKPPRVETPVVGQPPITIPGEAAPIFEPEVKEQLQVRIDLLRSRNPYKLDRTGMLQRPGFPPMMLAGLDDDQATHRLASEVALRDLDVKVTRLPVRKAGEAGLKPFGYDLFKDGFNTFAPVTDVPVPSDYIVGAGDQLNVQLFGSQNRNLRLVVGRDGRVNFPELGPINVSGRTFQQASADIERRVSQQLIGVRASVSMGDTRSIRVFVMGEASRPGSYTVSGLSTIT